MAAKYSDSNSDSAYFKDQASLSDHTVEIFDGETATQVESGV